MARTRGGQTLKWHLYSLACNSADNHNTLNSLLSDKRKEGERERGREVPPIFESSSPEVSLSGVPNDQVKKALSHLGPILERGTRIPNILFVTVIIFSHIHTILLWNPFSHHSFSASWTSEQHANILFLKFATGRKGHLGDGFLGKTT
ncbi:hypothetical protein Pfo_008135 [Paulownia fortunei]|nr:hypothetical protein Pfo_008135 [Paulownia fortunei]